MLAQTMFLVFQFFSELSHFRFSESAAMTSRNVQKTGAMQEDNHDLLSKISAQLIRTL
jgi:hypothetical protein